MVVCFILVDCNLLLRKSLVWPIDLITCLSWSRRRSSIPSDNFRTLVYHTMRIHCGYPMTPWISTTTMSSSSDRHDSHESLQPSSPKLHPRTSLDDSHSIHSTTSSIHPANTKQQPLPLTSIPSHISHSQDAPIQQHNSYVEVPDEIYDRIPPNRKVVIVALLSFCSFLAPISSTTVLAAVPEVASTYGSTGTIINLSNALYLVFMGVSPCFWGPLSQVYGRRWVSQFP